MRVGVFSRKTLVPQKTINFVSCRLIRGRKVAIKKVVDKPEGAFSSQHKFVDKDHYIQSIEKSDKFKNKNSSDNSKTLKSEVISPTVKQQGTYRTIAQQMKKF